MTYRYATSMGLQMLQLIALIESIFRGVTYLTVPREGTIVMTQIEASAPMQVWGIAFIFFAVLGLFGEALMSGTTTDPFRSNPRAWPSFVAHSGLMILYLTLCLAYAVACFDGSKVLAQASAAMFVFAFVHWLFAKRRKRHVV